MPIAQMAVIKVAAFFVHAKGNQVARFKFETWFNVERYNVVNLQATNCTAFFAALVTGYDLPL
jgi:hypothetical protein